jgi:HK97 gp10 family phage protein
MATATGRSEASAYIASLPEQLTRLLQGAARAGGRVIADEAKSRSVSDEVADAVVIRTKNDDHRVVVRVTIKPGWTYSRALWLEYGTSPHFISVDDEQRQALGIRRINAKVKEADGDGSLVIGGKFVGKTLFHPGARPHPFLRPALDTKEAEAVTAMQSYINARVSRAGIALTDDGDGA